MAYVATNNANSTLSAQLLVGGSTLSVAVGTGDLFPEVGGGDYTKVTLRDAAGNIEIVRVTSRSFGGDVMAIQRGEEGTTPRQWEVGTAVSCRLTAALSSDAVNQPALSAEVATKAAASHLHTGIYDPFLDPSGNSLRYIRANAAGTAREYRTPEQARTDLAAAAEVSFQTIWLPAAAMTPLEGAEGASLEVTQLAANKTVLSALSFAHDVNQHAQFTVGMPDGWNEATGFTVRFVWAHGAAVTNFGTAWNVRAKAINDGGGLDGAWGIRQQVNDTGGATNTRYQTAETATVTPSGTPTTGASVVFEFGRVADDAANDTLAVPALLLGVIIKYQTTSLSDA